MTAPFHKLKHEHRIIEQGLRALNGISLRLDYGERIPPESLSRMVDFIRTFADRFHHGKEEMHLFPALEQHGFMREGGPLGVIEEEHEIERRLLAELDEAIGAYRNGDAGASRHFADTARKYADHLIRHVHKEDNILFRLADDMLDEKEKASLSDAFKQVEIEMGEGLIEKYERMAEELEEEWSV